MTSLSALSLDELADGICLRAGRIAAAQAELLLWIGEFDPTTSGTGAAAVRPTCRTPSSSAPRHHTLIHAHGDQLTLHPDRRLDVHTADGTAVLHHPAQPWGDPTALAAGCGQHVFAETLLPDHTDDRLDLHDAVCVLLAHAA